MRGRALPCLTLVSPGRSGPTCCPAWGFPFSGLAPFPEPQALNILGLYDLYWWVMLEPGPRSRGLSGLAAAAAERRVRR